MPARVHASPREQEGSTSTWIVIFVLLSLLAHALLFLGVFLVALMTPKITLPPPPAQMIFSLEAAPKPPPPMPRLIPLPPPPHEFVRTEPQQNAPHKPTLFVAENDTALTSRSNTTRNPNSTMPNVDSRNKHPGDRVVSPNSTTHEKPEPAKSQPSPTPLHPPHETPERNTQPKPPTPPAPADPLNSDGLPVLPPIVAPTLAEQTPPGAKPMIAQAQVYPEIDTDISGRAGLSGKPSPEAMKTDLGQYKAKVWRAVASRWYDKVDNAVQRLSVGEVRLRYTIFSDGTIEIVKVTEGDNLDQLLSISQNSLTEAAPFPAFTDGVIKELHGATSYTDEFSFEVY